MNIKRNAEKELAVTKQIQENYGNKEREGIHLSDLLAPRKAYWKKINPKPLDITEILYFVSGTGIEEELTSLLGEKHGRTRQAYGIYYSPDLRTPWLTEVKSRRRYLPEEGTEKEEFAYYLSQLTGYMALDGVTEGVLIVLSLNEKVDETHRTEPQLACYDVTIDKDEIKDIRMHYKAVKETLEYALKEESHTYLPLCPEWMCGRRIKTMTKPPMCIDCGRTFTNDYLVKKHKEGKKSLTHRVEYAEYDWTFEPRCKWYHECLENNCEQICFETPEDTEQGSLFEGIKEGISLQD